MFIPLIKLIYQNMNKKKSKIKKEVNEIENTEDLFVVASIKLVTGEELICYYRPTKEKDKILIGAPMAFKQVSVSVNENEHTIVNALMPWSLLAPIEKRYLSTVDVISIVILESSHMSLSQVQIVNEYKLSVHKIIEDEHKKIDEYMHKSQELVLNKIKLEKLYNEQEKENT